MIRAAAEFRGVLAPAIHRFKYGGRPTLCRAFAKLMLAAWEAYPELQAGVALVPVPLHPKSERLRGYNQSGVLAHSLSGEIGRPVLPILERSRKTPSQVKLDRDKRGANVRGAFYVIPWAVARQKTLKNHTFLLIDDVCTTKSTLVECARTLRKAGIRRVSALVLARDL